MRLLSTRSSPSPRDTNPKTTQEQQCPGLGAIAYPGQGPAWDCSSPASHPGWFGRDFAGRTGFSKISFPLINLKQSEQEILEQYLTHAAVNPPVLPTPETATASQEISALSSNASMLCLPEVKYP